MPPSGTGTPLRQIKNADNEPSSDQITTVMTFVLKFKLSTCLHIIEFEFTTSHPTISTQKPSKLK